jgi:hypothetical protein
MKPSLDMTATRRLLVEWKEPRATALLEELETGIAAEARAFREAIVARWAAEYASKRDGDGGQDPAAALADLRRWSRAYFQAADGDGRDDGDPSPGHAQLDVRAA